MSNVTDNEILTGATIRQKSISNELTFVLCLRYIVAVCVIIVPNAFTSLKYKKIDTTDIEVSSLMTVNST